MDWERYLKEILFQDNHLGQNRKSFSLWTFIPLDFLIFLCGSWFRSWSAALAFSPLSFWLSCRLSSSLRMTLFFWIGFVKESDSDIFGTVNLDHQRFPHVGFHLARCDIARQVGFSQKLSLCCSGHLMSSHSGSEHQHHPLQSLLTALLMVLTSHHIPIFNKLLKLISCAGCHSAAIL